MTFSGKTAQTGKKLAGLILALALLCPNASVLTNPKVNNSKNCLAPVLGTWQQESEQVQSNSSMLIDHPEEIELSEQIKRFVETAVTTHKTDESFRAALNRLQSSESSAEDTIADLLTVSDYLKDYPLLRHLEARHSPVALLQETYKTLSLKVNVGPKGSIVCVVTWPSQGPLGLKTINDKLGWNTSDRIRSLIFNQVAADASLYFADNPPQNVKDAQEKIEEILDKSMGEFIDIMHKILKAAEKGDYFYTKANVLNLTPEAVEHFVKYADTFNLQATASYPVSISTTESQEDMIKSLTSMEAFALAKAKLGDKSIFNPEMNQLEALDAFAYILDNPDLRFEELNDVMLEKIRKGSAIPEYMEETAALLRVFGRPKPFSVNDAHALEKVITASNLYARLQLFAADSRLKAHNITPKIKKDIQEISVKVAEISNIDPRSVSFDYMDTMLHKSEKTKRAKGMDGLDFMSKSLYTETFLKAMDDHEAFYKQVTDVSRADEVPMEVFGDEALFLTSMPQPDGSYATTEIYTDVQGLGITNLRDVLRLINIHRYCARVLRSAATPEEFSNALIHLLLRYDSKTHYSTSARKILDWHIEDWEDNMSYESMGHLTQVILRDLAQMVLNEAEDMITVKLRQSEVDITKAYAKMQPTDRDSMNRFVKTIMQKGRRCVAVTLTDTDITNSADLKEDFKIIEEYGLGIAKEMEKKGLKNFYLHYTGTMHKGEWRAIFYHKKYDAEQNKEVDIFYDRNMDGIAALLRIPVQAQNVPVSEFKDIRLAA